MSLLELLKLFIPETMLALTAMMVLLVDLTWLREGSLAQRMKTAAILTALGCLAALTWLLAMPQAGSLFNGMASIGPLSQLTKVVLVILTMAAAVLSREVEFTPHVGEYFTLLILATLGLMFMVSTEEILMIFLSLELASLSFYMLAAFAKRSATSLEAGLKYFLFGGISAAFLLFGLSLLYGLTGVTNLSVMAQKLELLGLDPLLMAALAMVVVGLGFKIAIVPFHLWAPDVYQGAPTPAAALIASGSKVASFFLLARFMMTAFDGFAGSADWGGFAPGWTPLLASVAALSMVFGNLTAMAQNSVKRLLAYSAIAHAGYLVVGLLAVNKDGLAAVLYYVFVYALTVMGAFGVLAVVAEKTGGDHLSNLAGLSRRSPFLAFCLLVFLLSLAGIPPLAGFFGKFYLFVAALRTTPHTLGLLWLVILAVAMSAVSLYYYLQVLKQVYVGEPDPRLPAIPCLLSTRIVIGLLMLAVVLFGCLPQLLLGKILAGIGAIVG
jgi:NADH-quinone oxidoreductase subunit N